MAIYQRRVRPVVEDVNKQETFKWFNDDNNIERWYCKEIFTGSEKHIWITKWVEILIE